MTDNTITEKDVKTLQSYETFLGKIVNWAVILTPVFLIGLCLFNLYLASKIGKNAEVDLFDLLQTWVKGVNVNDAYPGIVVFGLERIGMAVFQFGLSVIFAILSYAYHKRRKIDLRIIATLKNKGLL